MKTILLTDQYWKFEAAKDDANEQMKGRKGGRG